MNAVHATTAIGNRRQTGRAYFITVAAGWTALSAAAEFFARMRGIAAGVAVPLVLAFLTEFSFYILPAFPAVLRSVQRWGKPPHIAGWLAGTALLPYLIYAIPTGHFGWAQLACLAAIMTAAACWYVWPPAAWRDVLFLAFLAAVILSGVLKWIFPAVVPKLPLDTLGHITLVRTAILGVLLLRDTRNEMRIGFIPTARELGVGLLWFVACAACAAPFAMLLHVARFPVKAPALWPSIALILGLFWFVAFSEEFFFRQLLQPWIAGWTKSRAAGVVIASLLFGACHLGYRGFPNWRFAILAAILGFACSGAFLQAGSIRASMVTHALAAGAWRLLFS